MTIYLIFIEPTKATLLILECICRGSLRDVTKLEVCENKSDNDTRSKKDLGTSTLYTLDMFFASMHFSKKVVSTSGHKTITWQHNFAAFHVT